MFTVAGDTVLLRVPSVEGVTRSGGSGQWVYSIRGFYTEFFQISTNKTTVIAIFKNILLPLLLRFHILTHCGYSCIQDFVFQWIKNN
jgi:hypothetical protein